MIPPLVKGGQGRSDADVIDDGAGALVWAVVCAALVVGWMTWRAFA